MYQNLRYVYPKFIVEEILFVKRLFFNKRFDTLRYIKLILCKAKIIKT